MGHQSDDLDIREGDLVAWETGMNKGTGVVLKVISSVSDLVGTPLENARIQFGSDSQCYYVFDGSTNDVHFLAGVNISLVSRPDT